MIREAVITRAGRKNLISALVNGSAWTLSAIGLGDSGSHPTMDDYDLLGSNKYYVNCSPSYNKSEGYIQFNYSFSAQDITFEIREIGVFRNTSNTSGYMFMRAICDTIKFQNNSDWLDITIVLSVP